MLTPDSEIRVQEVEVDSKKRGREPPADVEASASPDLKKGKKETMKRTPQPALTQSKLTSMLQATHQRSVASSPTIHPIALAAGSGTGVSDMDTSPPRSAHGDATKPQTVTTDVLLRSLRENNEVLLKSFTASLGAITARVEDNTIKIDDNTKAISRQAACSDRHEAELRNLASRVQAIEDGGGRASHDPHRRATLSEAYLEARRSIRLWPVPGLSEDDLWGGVGEFLHGPLAIDATEICQDDIEGVRRVGQQNGGLVNDEVVVTFRTKEIRDLVAVSAANLATAVDPGGRPTAGVRIEVPEELRDTFRLLSRFGTRLRARHGTGLKRHIKFDDFCGSLYVNVKLPGDEKWTRITPALAREDLSASVQAENAATQKRLAVKLLPGPRERLSRPLPVPGSSTAAPRRLPSREAPREGGGQRPRWAGPSRPRTVDRS